MVGGLEVRGLYPCNDLTALVLLTVPMEWIVSLD